MLIGIVYLAILTWLVGRASKGIHSLGDFMGCLIVAFVFFGIVAAAFQLGLGLSDKVNSTLSFGLVGGILWYGGNRRRQMEKNQHGVR